MTGSSSQQRWNAMRTDPAACFDNKIYIIEGIQQILVSFFRVLMKNFKIFLLDSYVKTLEKKGLRIH